MYRADSKVLTCTVCTSPHVTPETKFDPSEGFAKVHFNLKTPAPGFFSESWMSLKVDRARLCLACGHVMYFLSPRARQELERRMPELEAIPPSDD